MEFQYRAGDERRSQSPPPPTSTPPTARSTSASGSAGGHGGDDGPAERVSDSALVPPQPPPPAPPAVAAADSADELQRQAQKAKIRERILREEADHWELELEVRREIREQLLSLSWPALGRSAGGSGSPVAPSPERIDAANASLPAFALEVHPKANAPAASSAKRKSPDHAAASTLSGATSSKKQKISLACMVCGISTNSEKTMQDHLNGKVHKRKATALMELSYKPMVEPESKDVLALSGDYKPMKLTMLTNSGALNEVMQMDGYLLCEVCNVRTVDRVTMMCHLEGSKHISKGQKNGQASSKPRGNAIQKGMKGVSVTEAATSAVASADPDPETLVLNGVPHTVRQLEGFLLCELCNVKVPSMNSMQLHLSGKKHRTKVNTTSEASANISTGGKEVTKAQPMDTDTAVVTDIVVQVEAPSMKSLEAKFGDGSELRETTEASTKEDIAIRDSTKTNSGKVTKASASAAAAQDNNVCGSDSLTMEVDSVHHPLRRVDGFLVCPFCNVKVPSEIIMQSHLSGKKHKHKMTLAARVNKKDASVLATVADELQGNSSTSLKANVDAESAPSLLPHTSNVTRMGPVEADRPTEGKPAAHIEHTEDGEATRVQSNSSESVKAGQDAELVPSLAAEQVENAAAVAPMELDYPTEIQPAVNIKPTEDGDITEEAGREHAAAEANGSVTQAKETVQTDDTAVPGKPFKIEVEGKLCIVQHQENGTFSCELCGIHGCNKDGMIMHLYTRTHWDKANLAAAAAVDKSIDGSSVAGNGSVEH